MNLKDIRNEADIVSYIQGIMNDLKYGLSDQNEAEWRVINLIIYLVNLDRVKNIDFRRQCENACDWPDCTLPGCVINKP